MKASTCLFLAFFTAVLIGCSVNAQNDDLELVGHRGATGFMPENSVPGFKKALDFNVNSIEFDVVVSGDERVVISHDPWFNHKICTTPEGDSIDRERQMEHLIYEMSYDEIARYDCGSLQHPSFPEQQTLSLSKPLMQEAIRNVETYREENNYPPVKYNVEIKSNPAWDNELQPAPDVVAQLVYDELEALDMMGRVRVFAFDVRILQAMNNIDPSLQQVYLVSQSKPDIEENLDELGHKPAVYAPHYPMVDSALVAEVHERDMKIIPWTVNNYDDMMRLVQTGVDGIISDYPNHFEELREFQAASETQE